MRMPGHVEIEDGLADRQRDLAGPEVDVVIKELARARGFEAQKEALGAESTALVNVVSELARSTNRFVPDILVNGSDGAGGAMSAGVMGFLREFQRVKAPGETREDPIAPAP